MEFTIWFVIGALVAVAIFVVILCCVIRKRAMNTNQSSKKLAENVKKVQNKYSKNHSIAENQNKDSTLKISESFKKTITNVNLNINTLTINKNRIYNKNESATVNDPSSSLIRMEESSILSLNNSKNNIIHPQVSPPIDLKIKPTPPQKRNFSSKLQNSGRNSADSTLKDNVGDFGEYRSKIVSRLNEDFYLKYNNRFEKMKKKVDHHKRKMTGETFEPKQPL
jgi:hypothetical protein